MSRFPTDPGSDIPQESGPLGAPVEQMPVEEPRRAASLTLRSDEVREQRIASMDAANKSLADALRITYRLIQFVMVGLVILFLFSGFQQVNQSESGLRVELGRIKAEQLEPGFQFSLPYPLGEIIKIETGNRTVEVDERFWPNVRPDMRRRPIEESGAMSTMQLEPGRDGSLLTADSNIAHAQWTVVYSRARPALFARNINPDFENAIVRSAVERAAVQVAASVMIDDLLKPGAAEGGSLGRENSVESRVRSLAQGMLDRMESGIEISQVVLRSATPPLYLKRDFNQVQIAQSNAGKAREQALGDRSKRLNEAAGTASTPLLDLIDDYEAALELGDAGEAERVLAEIDRLLLSEVRGANVRIGDREYGDVRLSGAAASIISESQQYRSTVVQQAQRQAETFRAKLNQYRTSPAVFATGELVEALRHFFNRRQTDIVWIPAGTRTFELRITRDPEIARQAERDRYEQDVEGNPRVREMRESLR